MASVGPGRAAVPTTPVIHFTPSTLITEEPPKCAEEPKLCTAAVVNFERALGPLALVRVPQAVSLRLKPHPDDCKQLKCRLFNCTFTRRRRLRSTFAVACGLRQLLRPQFRAVFTPLLEQLVRLNHSLSIQASLLAQDFLLSRLESGVLQPFGDLVSLYQTFLNRVKALISTPTEHARLPRGNVLPAGLREVRDLHIQDCRPADFVPTRRPGWAAPVILTPFLSTCCIKFYGQGLNLNLGDADHQHLQPEGGGQLCQPYRQELQAIRPSLPENCNSSTAKCTKTSIRGTKWACSSRAALPCNTQTL